MRAKAKGSLIIIGGGEDKTREGSILGQVAAKANEKKGPLVVITAATTLPQEVGAEYIQAFNRLDVRDVKVVNIQKRDDAYDQENVETILKASLIFFTGGDQLRITSQIGDSPTFRCMDEMYRQGATIAGTSAGAAAMSETMLLSGPGDESHRLFSLDMAPGLGFLRDVVVDTHFAERGRIGRLLGVVAQNPRNLGVGIDEDTAIVVEREESFRVLGSGAVYVVDGTGVNYTNLSEKEGEGALCMYNVKLHILGEGARYDLVIREPKEPKVAAHA